MLFAEDFEAAGDGANVLLTDYVGAQGPSYTGDDFWVSRPNCNGFIVDQTSPRQDGDCSALSTGGYSYNRLTGLSYALGMLQGAADPALNAAAASYTAGDGPDDAVQFRTATPLALAADNRFVTFSVDAAATNCNSPNHPALRFYLVDATGTQIPVSDAAIDPCEDPRSSSFTGVAANGANVPVQAGSFAADSSTLLSGGSFDVVLRNETGSGAGNDGAYDNIQVLDVTPQLSKEFAPATVAVGGKSRLTFTVTNTSELAAKDGWGFTDALPAGLTAAAVPNVDNQCTDATVDAAAGAEKVVVSGGSLASQEASCTISLDVTSAKAGTYTNGADQLTELVGLAAPADAAVEFAVANLELAKSVAGIDDVNSDGLTDRGDVISYAFTVTNTGGVRLDDVAVDDPKVADLTCPETSLAAGASMDCSATFEVTADDESAGAVDNTAKATGQAVGGIGVMSGASRTSTPVTAAAPSLSFVKTVDAPDVTGLAAGDEVTYTLVTTNDGNVPLRDVQVDDSQFSGAGDLGGLTCEPGAPAVLAPGESLSCTASYTVVQADIDAGTVDNMATVTATGPYGEQLDGSDSANLPAARTASTELTKTATVEDEDEDGLADEGEGIDYTFTVLNTGNVTLASVGVDDPMLTEAGITVACDALSIAPGAITSCAASAPYLVTDADVEAGSVENTATTVAAAPTGVDVVPSTATASTPTDTRAVLELTKTADVSSAQPGDVVTFTIVAANAGNVALSDVEVSETEFIGAGDLTDLECRAGDSDGQGVSLAPGEQVECTTTYTVTEADVANGRVNNTAGATALTSQGTPLQEQDEAGVDIAPAPVPAVDPTPTPSAAAPVVPDPELPQTGLSVTTFAVLGAAVLLVIAGGLVLVLRRRQNHHVQD
ncbi:DUF7507 domain-containing protein [Isoptericola sp. NPDC055881]